jgi:Holliday junction resolvase-like predicted endonuclease
VTRGKQRRIARLACEYAAEARWVGRPCRFDVVTIHLDVDPALVTVYPNAFDAP